MHWQVTLQVNFQTGNISFAQLCSSEGSLCSEQKKGKCEDYVSCKMARTFGRSSPFLAMAKKASMQIPPLAPPPLQCQPDNDDTEYMATALWNALLYCDRHQDVTQEKEGK